ncbi:MAG: hypothetical protein IJB67_07295 [Firmicutes bacterium]|nr:hypothetical protein [Bacillota bacterium]
MTEVVGIRFERAGKIYYFELCGVEAAYGDHVIVESSRGLDYGTVATPKQDIDAEQLPQPVRPVIRLATEEDEQSYQQNRLKEPAAFEFCQQQILAANLPMKLIKAVYTFDGSKIVFYFSSDNRVDFRELVKVLAAHFHTRIELRQIGVRDEARLVGGYSTCGRELCCSAFLDNFHPVSIKMAKKQGLALNPAKISGVCSRLMCCLYYEYDEDAPAPAKAENAAPQPMCDKNCSTCTDKLCRAGRPADDNELDLESAELAAAADVSTAAVVDMAVDMADEILGDAVVNMPFAAQDEAFAEDLLALEDEEPIEQQTEQPIEQQPEQPDPRKPQGNRPNRGPRRRNTRAEQGENNGDRHKEQGKDGRNNHKGGHKDSNKEGGKERFNRENKNHKENRDGKNNRNFDKAEKNAVNPEKKQDKRPDKQQDGDKDLRPDKKPNRRPNRRPDKRARQNAERGEGEKSVIAERNLGD